MKYLPFLMVAALLWGCKPSEKLQRSRAIQFYANHPGELAKKCADEYPVKDSVGKTVTDSVRPADNVDLSGALDSAKAEADQLRIQFAQDTTEQGRRYAQQISSITVRIDQLNKQYKPCEPEIIYQTKPVYRENTARLAAFKADADSLSRLVLVGAERERKAVERAENAEKQSKTRLFWIIGLIAAIVGGIVVQLKRLI